MLAHALKKKITEYIFFNSLPLGMRTAPGKQEDIQHVVAVKMSNSPKALCRRRYSYYDQVLRKGGVENLTEANNVRHLPGATHTSEGFPDQPLIPATEPQSSTTFPRLSAEAPAPAGPGTTRRAGHMLRPARWKLGTTTGPRGAPLPVTPPVSHVHACGFPRPGKRLEPKRPGACPRRGRRGAQGRAPGVLPAEPAASTRSDPPSPRGVGTTRASRLPFQSRDASPSGQC